MPEWESVKFEQLADPGRASFSIGPFGSSITKENYVSLGVPIVRGVNLARGRFLDDGFVFINSDKADQLTNANLTAGDLVFTHRGTIGQVSMIPRCPRFVRYVLSSSQVKARLNPTRAVPEFYYYWFRSPNGQHALLSHASTVGVPGIASPLATIRSIVVPVPPLKVQRSVADALGALDDKIAINERLARTSYDLANARFSISIRHANRKTFLRDIIDLRYGKALTEGNRELGKVPVFGSNGRSGWHSQALHPGPGIIVGRKGANAGSVSWSEGPFWVIDTAFFVDLISRDIPIEYLYFLLQRVGFRSQVGDSAIPGLNREIALACTAMLPPEDVIGCVASEVRPLLTLCAHMSDESASLTDLRDTLLPRLMSGKIRVADAERIVENAT